MGLVGSNAEANSDPVLKICASSSHDAGRVDETCLKTNTTLCSRHGYRNCVATETQNQLRALVSQVAWWTSPDLHRQAPHDAQLPPSAGVA